MARILIVALVLLLSVPVMGQKSVGEKEFNWCGNHIHDSSQPKGISIWAKSQLEKSVKTPPTANKGAVTVESEPNNSRNTADLITITGQSATIQGNRTLPISRPAPTLVRSTSAENNDSISTAFSLNLAADITNGRLVTNQVIGDGLFGATSGDMDFFSFTAKPGEILLFDVDSTTLFDPIVGIYDSSGTLIALNDDEVPSSKIDPNLVWTAETSGTYYLCVAGVARSVLSENFPTNPFTAGTGRGAGSVGSYNLEVFRLTPLVTAFEENGTISQAIPIINSPNTLAEFIIQGFIGDSFAISGDFDLYRFNAAAGQTFSFDVFTSDPAASSTLDPVLGVYNSGGTIIATAGDKDAQRGNFDPRLLFTAPTAGFYYLVIGAEVVSDPNFLEVNFPSNGFDGIGSGPASTGFYTIIVSTLNTDDEWLQFDLQEGQVFSARSLGAVNILGIEDPAFQPLAYTTQNVNAFSAPGTPLVNGEISLAFVAPQTGRYAMQLVSRGTLLKNQPWQIDILLSEPGLREEFIGQQQILFIDFNGATINASLVSGPNEMRTLSPLSTFLPMWGIPANQESALIDRILQTMQENLRADLITKGGNGDFSTTGNGGEFGLIILNSRDHADPFGQPNVSRIIIGGTVAQLGVQTIGIAQSIDPGNFNREETAVVLLDLLSDQNGGANSLNQFSLTGGATKIDLVGRAVGNIASHEAGHYFGNWHTINSNAQPNIMDQGGNLRGTLGIGPDNLFGSLDDVDVDFVTDQYEPKEVYPIGFENTLKTTTYGLSTGSLPVPIPPKDLWSFY